MTALPPVPCAHALNRWKRLLPGTALLALTLLAPIAPARAQIEGASYTLQPTYNIIRWGKEIGIEDTELIGGRLGLNLGQYVSLQGFYLGRNNIDTRLTGLGLPGPGGSPLVDQQLNLSHYGADLIFNVGSSANVVPFVKVGGGIVRFDPETGDESEHIAVKAGGGVRFGIARLQAEVFAEDLAFRLDRYRLAPIGFDPLLVDPEDNDLRHNLSIGLGLNFNLGGQQQGRLTETDRAIAERFRRGLAGVSLPIEPFVGRLNFSDDLALDTQELFGLRTGLDFGRYFGVRGYYWRGVNDDFDDTEDVQSWGGEAQFNLNAGNGAVPFLIAGLGKLDFRDEFVDENGFGRDDETMLILGAGLGLNLSDRLRLDVAARDYVISNEDLDELNTTDELSSNWMISAGLSFSLFGDSPDRGTVFSGRDPERERVVVLDAEDDADDDDEKIDGLTDAEVKRMRERRAARVELGRQLRERRLERLDRLDRLEGREPGSVDRSTQPPAVRNYQGDQVVTIPVPEEGELYVRYGTPGGVSIESRTPGTGRGGAYWMPHPGMHGMHMAPPAPGEPGTAAPQWQPAPGAEGAPPQWQTGQAPASPQAPPAPPTPPAPPAPGAWTTPPPTGEGATGLTEEQRMERIEKLFTERMDQMESRINERLKDQERAIETREPAEGRPQTDWNESRGDTDSGPGWNPRAVRLYTGLNVDDPSQAVFGARLNLGPVARNSDFNFNPEVALGFGDGGTSFLASANLYYDFNTIASSGNWAPFLGAGIGILRFTDSDDDDTDISGTEAVLNIGYGLTANFGRTTAFAEHQGIDLFDLNRILVGVRLSLD